MSWKHQLYEIFRAEKWAIQSPGWERGHMIYPQSFKVSLMHTNFVTRSQKNLMFWIFFAQALLLLFKNRRKVSGQKMRTAYRIRRILKTYLVIHCCEGCRCNDWKPFLSKVWVVYSLNFLWHHCFRNDIYFDFFIEMVMLHKNKTANSSSFKYHDALTQNFESDQALAL